MTHGHKFKKMLEEDKADNALLEDFSSDDDTEATAAASEFNQKLKRINH